MQQQQAPRRITYSPDEIADRLGISISTYYREIAPHVFDGSIESFKLKRARRIYWDSLERWLKRRGGRL